MHLFWRTPSKSLSLNSLHREDIRKEHDEPTSERKTKLTYATIPARQNVLARIQTHVYNLSTPN